MKKLLLGTLLATALMSCHKNEDKTNNVSGNDTPCGDHKSQQLYKDSRGNCYLINSAGNKEYVEKHECNC